MLTKAIRSIKGDVNLILHSDQSWHYQYSDYQNALKNRDLTQSMSRKGNCLDNAEKQF